MDYQGSELKDLETLAKTARHGRMMAEQSGDTHDVDVTIMNMMIVMMTIIFCFLSLSASETSKSAGKDFYK